MIAEHNYKFPGLLSWRSALSTFAFGLGTIGLCSPVEAMVQITAKESFPLLENNIQNIQATSQTTDSQANFRLAQVGVRSRINGPTPLNITPPLGTHIPLPASNYNYRGYYHHPYHRGARRKYIHHRRSSRYDRYRPYYGGYNYRPHRRRHHKKGTRVIIINPATHRGYNHNSSYIRVIRR